MTTADALAASRLDGHTLSMGCLTCPLLRRCGGYRRVAGTWSCMDLCGQCDRTTCDKVCLKKPAQFAADLLEVGGFGFEAIPALLPPESASLPQYVPTIQHGIPDAERAPAVSRRQPRIDCQAVEVVEPLARRPRR